MPASSLGRRRPRPVADAPALDGAAVAKAWLVELVAIAPLDRAARVPGPRFAEDAPRLCAAVAAALASDAAFDDLEPGGPLAPLAAGAGHLADAPTPLEAVTALEALRAVTWAALHEALDRPDPRQVAELADRLSAVVATLTAAVLDVPPVSGPGHPGDRGPLAAVLRREHGAPDAPPPGEPESGAEPRATAEVEVAPREDEPAASGPSPLHDLEALVHDAAASDDPLARLRALALAARQPEDEDEAGPDPFSAAAARLRGSRAPVVEDASEFRAARIAPWIAAIDRRLARHRQDGLPFAVLCVELSDLDRLEALGEDEELVQALESAEQAVCSHLRPADALVRERPGRYWLTAPDTDAAEARALAHRIAGAVAAVAPHRGAPLQAAVGVACCPVDAIDAPSLEGRAEEGLFAARAAGVRVAPQSA